MTAINIILFFLFIVFPGAVWAQTNLPPVYEIVTDTLTKQEVDSTYWQVLEDKNGQWTLEEVSGPPLSQRFHYTNTRSSFPDSAVHTIWVRCLLQNTAPEVAKLSVGSGSGLTDFYIVKKDGATSHFTSGWQHPYSKRDGLKDRLAVHFTLLPGEEVKLYMRKHNQSEFTVPTGFKIPLYSTEKLLAEAVNDYQDNYVKTSSVYESLISGLLFLAAIFNFLIYYEKKEKVNLYFSLFLFFLFMVYSPIFKNLIPRESQLLADVFDFSGNFAFVFLLFFIRHYLQLYRVYPRWDKFLLVATIFSLSALLLFKLARPGSQHWLNTAKMVVLFTYTGLAMVTMLFAVIIAVRSWNSQAKIFLIAVLPLISLSILSFLLSLIFRHLFSIQTNRDVTDYVHGLAVVWAVVVFSRYLFREYGQQQRQLLMMQLNKEREQAAFIAQQKQELAKQVAERTEELKQSLDHLKATQAQLIQSEKMASLGELTAGIAHEIQNPLNFVNNFSEVNKELLDEMRAELHHGQVEAALAIAKELTENEEKIVHHGKRADTIVKGMLQHARATAGEKEPADINALAEEYLRLSYQSMRSKDKSFNAAFEMHFDETINRVDVVSQEIGRVLLNLFNNAFYAVSEKKRQLNGSYEPVVSVSTKRQDSVVEITVKDNGTGIPQKMVDKIFHPFFTTKPSGQGTGLGLSLSYDIIKSHRGELHVKTKEGHYTEFIIQLPAQQ